MKDREVYNQIINHYTSYRVIGVYKNCDYFFLRNTHKTYEAALSDIPEGVDDNVEFYVVKMDPVIVSS